MKETMPGVVDSSQVETLELVGEKLCLDFVNTVDSPVIAYSKEYLNSYADLVRWSRYVGILGEEEIGALLVKAAQERLQSVKVFEQALVMRKTLYHVFVAIARAKHPQETDLNTLKQMYMQGIEHAHFIETDTQFVWSQSERKREALDGMLWPIIHSAVDLLMSPDIKRVKECPGVGDCGWLFLDTSKNGSRVWCSMESCGSRAKMRRQYARKRTLHTQSSDS